MATRSLIAVLVLVVVASACVPDAGDPTTDSASNDVSTTLIDDSSTTTLPSKSTSPPTTEALTPPERGDPNDVASEAFWDAGTFGIADKPSQFDEDALIAIEQWLPTDLVDGLVWEVFNDRDAPNVLAVSVIPTLTWRGDPNFVPALIALLNDADATELEDGIFNIATPAGLQAAAWSTGDGFVIATSVDQNEATRYLRALASETEPQRVWDSGVCLYTDTDSETLPYAPFPADIVVPCSGPHNAEVLISEQVGTDADEYDGAEIQYQRNYRCDQAYTEVFGAQKDHTPTLITYMPDNDEWDRGDRYLACVVQIDGIDGLVLFEGPMIERSDLVWNPGTGDCLDQSLAAETVDCASPHPYQYIGDATVAHDVWPDDGGASFQDACTEALESFVVDGPVRVDVFATGLFPYGFEQGDRTVQCFAFAVEEQLVVDVAGSFDEVWRVIKSGGVAA